MNKQKVLFLGESLNIGGAEKALVSILRSIDYDQFDITLMLISDSGGFIDEIDKIKKLNHKYFIKPTQNKLISFFYKLKIKALYKWLPDKQAGNYLCRGYDVVVAFCEGYLTKWVAASTVKCKKIAWVHTDMIDNDWPVRSGIFSSCEQEKAAYQSFNNVVAVSDSVAKGMRTKFGLKNISTIYNILDSNIIDKSKSKVNLFSSGKLNLVSVGRLEPVKGYNILIEAVGNLINQQNLDITLFIIGAGSQRVILEDKVKSLGLGDKIFFAGHQINPYPYISHADVYICSSSHEGFNIALLEAMTLGKPIISTCCVGPKEILEDGKYGLLTENCVKGIANAIVRLYNSPEEIIRLSSLSLQRATHFEAKEQLAMIENMIAS